MMVTLIAFVAGSLAGDSAHLPWWVAQPKIAAISIYGELGWPGGMVLQLAFIAVLAVTTIRVERKRHGTLEAGEPVAGPKEIFNRLLFGRWPILWGALALAILNIATLLVPGGPGASPGAIPCGAQKSPKRAASMSPRGRSSKGRSRRGCWKPGSRKMSRR